jgi:uncharacterized protein (DUF305 family)
MHRFIVIGVVSFIVGGLVALVVQTSLGRHDNNSMNNSDSQMSTAAQSPMKTNSLKKLKGDAFDEAFIAAMIEHHQGAIDMAKLVATNAKHDEVKRLGQDILSAQTTEISLMESWQSAWGYTSATASHTMPGM